MQLKIVKQTVKKYANRFEFAEEFILLPNNKIRIKLIGSKYSCQIGVTVHKRYVFRSCSVLTF